MSYDAPIQEIVHLPSAAYGATTGSITVLGPKGKTGYVRDIHVIPSADCVGTTTVPEVTVGLSVGSTEYARFRLGTAAGAGYTAAAGAKRASALAVANGTPPVQNDFPGHVALETARIPADTVITITGKAGTGGTPAGTFSAQVKIDWF